MNSTQLLVFEFFAIKICFIYSSTLASYLPTCPFQHCKLVQAIQYSSHLSHSFFSLKDRVIILIIFFLMWKQIWETVNCLLSIHEFHVFELLLLLLLLLSLVLLLWLLSSTKLAWFGLEKGEDSSVFGLFPISFVLWRRNVPDKIVTNPHNSVAICDAFCESQSYKKMSK